MKARWTSQPGSWRLGLLMALATTTAVASPAITSSDAAPDPAIEALVATLGTRDHEAAVGLSRCDSRRVAGPLQSALNHGDVRVRAEAAWVAAQFAPSGH